MMRVKVFGGPGKGQPSSPSSPKSSSETPVLDNFGIDLTKAAEEGRLDPVVGQGKGNRATGTDIIAKKKE